MFQLVFATDGEIIVWHTELGHIYAFEIDTTRADLVSRFTHDAPDAEQPAAVHLDEARAYASTLARERRLITT